MTTKLWINLKELELLAISGLWIALLILAVQGRLSYLLEENELDGRQKGRCRPEMDLFRRIRLWSSVVLISTVLAILALIKDISLSMKYLFLNLSSLFVGLAFLLLFIAYARYLFTTYLIDFYATNFIVEPISLIETQKESEKGIGETNESTKIPKIKKVRKRRI